MYSQYLFFRTLQLTSVCFYIVRARSKRISSNSRLCRRILDELSEDQENSDVESSRDHDSDSVSSAPISTASNVYSQANAANKTLTRPESIASRRTSTSSATSHSTTQRLNVSHMVHVIREQRAEPFVSCQLLSELRDSEAVLPLIVDPFFDKVIERTDRQAPNSNSDAAVELFQVHLN